MIFNGEDVSSGGGACFESKQASGGPVDFVGAPNTVEVCTYEYRRRHPIGYERRLVLRQNGGWKRLTGFEVSIHALYLREKRNNRPIYSDATLYTAAREIRLIIPFRLKTQPRALVKYLCESLVCNGDKIQSIKAHHADNIGQAISAFAKIDSCKDLPYDEAMSPGARFGELMQRALLDYGYDIHGLAGFAPGPDLGVLGVRDPTVVRMFPEDALVAARRVDPELTRHWDLEMLAEDLIEKDLLLSRWDGTYETQCSYFDRNQKREIAKRVWLVKRELFGV